MRDDRHRQSIAIARRADMRSEVASGVPGGSCVRVCENVERAANSVRGITLNAEHTEHAETGMVKDWLLCGLGVLCVKRRGLFVEQRRVLAGALARACARPVPGTASAAGQCCRDKRGRLS